MHNSQTLLDQELITSSYHRRRRSLGGDDALCEARRHEAELRRILIEVDKAAWGEGNNGVIGVPALKSPIQSLNVAAENFIIATSDTSTQSGDSLRELLHGLRELLDMDIVFVAELVDGKKVFRDIDCAANEEVMVQEGTSVPWALTLCKRVVEGRAPQMMEDVRSDESLAELAAVKALDIGAYLSTPVVLRDGSVYGTLCCISHKARSALGSRQLDSLRYVAGIVASELEKRRG